MTEKTQNERFLEALKAKQDAEKQYGEAITAIAAEIAETDDGSIEKMTKMLLEDVVVDIKEGNSPFIQYPITVNEIQTKAGRDPLWKDARPRYSPHGTFVVVRPCAEEHKGKSFLGIFLGEMATQVCCSYQRETGILVYDVGMYNPAIFVPELGKTVFGYESWWGPIKCEDDLKDITDEDINNVWYVQAMKQLGVEPKALDKEADGQAQT